MDGSAIRQTYLDFFADRDHAVVPSASLIPVDPTLLLNNAGMVPFKSYMLGEETPPWLRAVTSQKCVRTIDIDIVGTTQRHLTFFEMMGNFSFGDYFKEKAIPWAYELVTERFGLDPDRLWMTVHETDDEAAEIWLDAVGIDPARLQRRDRDNIWQMGVPGPAGPSSEIFYDKGPEYGPDGGPVVDEERFQEFWNLVFMQNIQDEPYHFIGDLPTKNIDTGMGLERMAVVLQDAESVFHTDLVRPIVAAGEKLTGARFEESERSDVSLRILADHARAVTALISDKVVPSNEGRGYVLRRLLRRAVRHASILGAKDLVMPGLIDATVAVLGGAFPELVDKRDAIITMAEREELRFRRTLESGHQLLDQELTTMSGSVFSGAAAFKLHDTYGFPKELTKEILSEKGIELDLAEFERMMDDQRSRARSAYRGGDSAAQADVYRTLLKGIDVGQFVGYELDGSEGCILAMVREGDLVDRAESGEKVELFLDRTPFYAESGGQIGDTGTITTQTGVIKLTDTQYALPGIHGHRGAVTSGYIQAGQDVTSVIDGSRRERIRKNHSGTHLLHWALREVVGEHAHQAGSLVADDRLRFDFSHYTGLEPKALLEVEQAVNERVIENAAVTTLETSKQEAEAMGALAFFGDKYGERVRVVKAGDYSTEFCGGTHVHSTGQIGPLIILSEGSVAANTRRVEALTGVAAYEHLAEMRQRIQTLSDRLKTQPGQLVQSAEGLLLKVKDQEERIEQFEATTRSELAAALLAEAEQHGSHSLLVALREGLDSDELRALAYQVRERLGQGVGVLGSVRNGKGALLAFVSKDLVASGVSAAGIIAEAAGVLGGGGGKDPELAQAGGPKGDLIEDALDVAKASARAALLEQ